MRNGRLPGGQMGTLRMVDESHGYGIDLQGAGWWWALVTIGCYQVPAEWRTLTEEQRGIGSVGVSSGAPRSISWWGINFSSAG
jgi:hypothetical protein